MVIYFIHIHIHTATFSYTTLIQIATTKFTATLQPEEGTFFRFIFEFNKCM